MHAKREGISASRAWVRVGAENHKSFRVWDSFVIHYYSVYPAFRTNPCMEKVLLRLAGLRRTTLQHSVGQVKNVVSGRSFYLMHMAHIQNQM